MTRKTVQNIKRVTTDPARPRRSQVINAQVRPRIALATKTGRVGRGAYATQITKHPISRQTIANRNRGYGSKSQTGPPSESITAKISVQMPTMSVHFIHPRANHKLPREISSRDNGGDVIGRPNAIAYKSISRRRGSSKASFTRTRNVTASLPSMIRWS